MGTPITSLSFACLPGSSLSTSSYRRSTALSPSRFQSSSTVPSSSSSSSSTSGLGVGYYRSLSSSSNYLSNRSSIAGYPSNESSYVSSRYSSKSTTGGDSGLGSNERARGSGFLGSRVSGIPFFFFFFISVLAAFYLHLRFGLLYWTRCE